jgi:two-component system, chemotaxis family, chemotaxis protein CheY
MIKNDILIIDDSKTSQMITKSCLEICGIIPKAFLFAANGKEGISILDQNDIDLIIVDLNMPIMSGEEFLEKLKKNEEKKDIPVLVLSSIINQAKEKELMGLGTMQFTKKPLNPTKLKSIVSEMLGV